jgi:hypothetical protein
MRIRIKAEADYSATAKADQTAPFDIDMPVVLECGNPL